jgi:hypothetical protein
VQTGARLRSTRDGQLGFLTETEDGTLAVRLDRRVDARVVPYVAAEWIPDGEIKLTPIQVARVLYDADRAMRLSLGEYGVPDWLSLREPQRHDWVNGKAWDKNEPPLRRKVRVAIMKVLLT